MIAPNPPMPNNCHGLAETDVQARIARGEVNRIVMPTSRTALEIVRANVLTRFNAILGALFVVILMTGPWQDGLFGGVFVLNTLIGIVQELRAKRTLDRLALVSHSGQSSWQLLCYIRNKRLGSNGRLILPAQSDHQGGCLCACLTSTNP